MKSYNDSLHEQLNIPLQRINRDLERIVLHDPDVSSRSIVAQSVLELIRAGGKRLRPMMTIVGSRFGTEPESDDAYRLAAVVEFIHAASLVHDDILDQADMRRGQPALHRKTGIYKAVHIGNYMMSRVIELMTANVQEPERYIQDVTSVTTTQLCIGEYQQMHHRYNFELSLDEYWEKTRNKTALLMATCLQVGAKASYAEDLVSDRLYAFGDNLGMAFQVRDDIMDFTKSAEQLGKPAGADLRNGHATLPVILAMKDEAVARKLLELHSASPDAAFDEAIELIRASGALEQALLMSHDFMRRAWNIIDQLSDFTAHKDLTTLWNYFEDRTY
ncbi:polyprenyl synthetase family protein [Paenibacillus apiarius]|uniref:Polyprenyl synthetase family protein n=1 Tax=Paenibacillus apiarius TaxID=46240 RepID=A0ABT4DNF1_9BACL|nr:polyprenyl synthetase family protein [Paenibacillus apiarius]MCY9515479.1 polyprenyl synthetase family protein [Paenibacillus apiarius]MCY9518888.1 polyprenyl synthetase family protein [Paenibacillus apiarius]MCY9552066.1 polyprenyl synthetase family protein [Paenibacillus apiarius]MCY9557258.1 polyprenyl synthetase family protein [Paenibacillus apiarius]MCY9682563.1 polyprenyl synthetase family protein [Paenibacillus apiarius]